MTTPEPKPNDPEYYPRIKFDGRWLVMAPEIVKKDAEYSNRCTGCAFAKGGEYSCLAHTATLEERGANCEGLKSDGDERPGFIFVDESKWEEYLAAQVVERLEG